MRQDMINDYNFPQIGSMEWNGERIKAEYMPNSKSPTIRESFEVVWGNRTLKMESAGSNNLLYEALQSTH
jgi:hypothetical protein